MTREEELKLQEDFIKNNPITVLPLSESKFVTRQEYKSLKKKHKKVHKTYSKKLKHYSNCLFFNQTLSEKRFKGALLAVLGWKEYHRIVIEQKVIQIDRRIGYICDFYIKGHNIVIEIDGKDHNTKKKKRSDKRRDNKILKHYGFKTYRITNEQTEDYEYCMKWAKNLLFA